MTAPVQDSESLLRRRLGDAGHVGSAVGHHVINAFTAVVSNLEMLRFRSSLPASIDMTSMVDELIQTALEASGVARRLIDYTRPLTTPVAEDLALDRFVADYVEQQRATAPSRVTWSTKLAEVPIIRAQADHLRTMLDYLVENSLESRPDGPLNIFATTDVDSRGWVVLELGDDGSGMTEKVLKQATEPFFTTKPGHPGVGLSIANGILRRHRGSLSIKSQPGEGTVIRLCIEPPREPASTNR